MKKFIVPVIFIFTALIVVSAYKPFATKSKPLSVTTYYYDGDDQRIDAGYSGQADSRENTLTESSFTDDFNWTTSPKTCGCSNGSYICSIEFNYESVADGGCDGQLTLHEAKMAVWYYWLSNGFTLPPDGGQIAVCNAVITIRRKCAVS